MARMHQVKEGMRAFTTPCCRVRVQNPGTVVHCGCLPPVEKAEGPQEPPAEWDVSQQSRGLGDTIAKFTHRMGIRQCGGCKGRQALANRVVPYR